MNYEVMETTPLKTKKGTVKIKKYQFDTKEEAEQFALTSPYRTQVYKIEYLKNDKKS